VTDQTKFKKLLEPCRIGELELKNRIIMSAVSPMIATDEGMVTQKTCDFFEARAKGGVGLIIVEGAIIQWPVGKSYNHTMRIDGDKCLPGLTELAKVIARHNCKPAIQLQHAGRLSEANTRGTLKAVAPSAIAASKGYEIPQELTTSEVEDMVRRFVDAAALAKKAGFVGVEINGHGGYLVHEFLSRNSNKRQDRYGGSLENRTRFLTDIIQGIKQANGKKYPVWCRLVGRDYGFETGITTDEAGEIAKLVEKAGADAIHVTVYGYGVLARMVFPDVPGALVPLAEGIKKLVKIPVIAHGRITPELGEKIIREGKADIIAMGRRLIADPELPNKLATGQLADIVPCTGCLHCQDSALSRGEPMRCRINAAMGKERAYELKPAEKVKKVLVVGGGPAGMEVARVAALRGHHVQLFEKQPRLGGQAILARMIHHAMDYHDDIKCLTDYLSRQVKKLGVNINLGKEVTPALIEQIKPDVVILATGASATVLTIPGMKNEKVQEPGQIYHKVNFWLKFVSPETLSDLTKYYLPLGKKIVIVGGGTAGIQLAGFLAKRKRKVTVVESSAKFANDMVRMYRRVLLDSLAEKGAETFKSVKFEEINQQGLVITDQEGKKQTLDADTIVSIIGYEPNKELFKALNGKVPELYCIGDCSEPHLILEAIHDGSRIARAI
jgi:2,4-dienoyl-CoA reductase (NADPH2)